MNRLCLVSLLLLIFSAGPALGAEHCIDGNGNAITGFHKVTLLSASKSYTCNVGYYLAVKWEIFTSAKIYSDGSSGMVSLKDSGSTKIFSSTRSISVSSDKSHGPDFPPGTYRQIISYYSGWVDVDTYQHASILTAEALFETICPKINPAYTGQDVFAGDVSSVPSTPCQRTDRVYVNPPSYNPDGTVAALGSFSGCNVFLQQCPEDLSYVWPDQHHVRVVNHVTGQIYYDVDLAIHAVFVIPNGVIPRNTKVRFEYQNKQNSGCLGPIAISLWNF